MPTTPTTHRNEPKHRFGLMKMRVGSQHQVTIDGQKQLLVARDRDEFSEAKTEVRCLFCKTGYPTVDAMMAAHSDHKVLVQAEEKHVWGWYSHDPHDPNVKLAEPKKGASPEETKAVEAANRAIPRIGFLSDETFEDG